MGKVVDEQWLFVQDIVRLINYCFYHGWVITFGEVYRTEYQQKYYLDHGLSKTMNSLHRKRLAIDLNFFLDGKWIKDKKRLQNIGDYWQGLDKCNAWGGFWEFVDTPHFERRHEPRLDKTL